MDDEYELTDSEDDYSREDKLLLEDARKLMKGREISSDEEVFGFGEDDSEDDDDDQGDEEEEEDGTDMGSDIEDEEKLPDERAWGKKKRSFYNTDFVDQDYEGVYQGNEAEIAELEEQEALNIQKRLTEQLNEADFSITEAVDIAEAAEATEKQEVIQSDLSKLTKRQKLDLLKKESPEFFVLVEDFKDKMAEAQKINLVICYYKKHVQKPVSGVEFLQTKLSLILKYRQLLEQLDELNKKVEPELKKILEMLEANEEIPIDESLVENTEKKKLKILTKSEQQREKKLLMDKEEVGEEEDVEMEGIEEEGLATAKEEKRAITYEMAKNKGLIPKRSKVQRNPRVKHRRKYEKAKIRRRGQVRTPRAEIPVYGGELTGIKLGLTKSIKFK